MKNMNFFAVVSAEGAHTFSCENDDLETLQREIEEAGLLKNQRASRIIIGKAKMLMERTMRCDRRSMSCLESMECDVGIGNGIATILWHSEITKEDIPRDANYVLGTVLPDMQRRSCA